MQHFYVTGIDDEQVSAYRMCSSEEVQLYHSIESLNNNCFPPLGGGALGYFLGGYVPPGTPNWHPVLKKNSPKIDTPF